MSGLQGRRLRLAAVFGTAAALAAVLVGASLIGSRDEGSAPAPAAAPEQERSLFAGIEQNGPALGSPRAPLTLVEYADLQCPYCAQWARDALPTLVEDYVRAGRLRIVFHGLAFIGPDSDKALRTAVAAGREDHLWDVVHGLYLSQGGENAGWVTDELVAGIAKGVPGLDADGAARGAVGGLRRSGAEAVRGGGQGRRRPGHAGVPARPDGRPAGARPGRLARAGGDRSGDRRCARPVSERTVRIASAALAALGAAISAYLLYVRETGGALVCSTGGCETVQSSVYAEVLGLPVAALGLAGFLGLLGASLGRGELGAPRAGDARALAAFLFAAYLLAIQLFVIDALCQWCLATDLLTTAIATLALVRLRPLRAPG